MYSRKSFSGQSECISQFRLCPLIHSEYFLFRFMYICMCSVCMCMYECFLCVCMCVCVCFIRTCAYFITHSIVVRLVVIRTLAVSVLPLQSLVGVMYKIIEEDPPPLPYTFRPIFQLLLNK